MTMKDHDRIKRRIHKKPNGCHGWYGCVDSSGFPQAMIDGKSNKVHRWLFARAHPEMEIKGWCVIQTCMDKGCLNVDHMERMTKTASERMKNSLAGRSPLLNWDIVAAVRRVPKGTGTKELVERTGVAASTIRRIRSN